MGCISSKSLKEDPRNPGTYRYSNNHRWTSSFGGGVGGGFGGGGGGDCGGRFGGGCGGGDGGGGGGCGWSMSLSKANIFDWNKEKFIVDYLCMFWNIWITLDISFCFSYQ